MNSPFEQFKPSVDGEKVKLFPLGEIYADIYIDEEKNVSKHGKPKKSHIL